jgi:predicted signal transduction protein with EAL and GGDEF domain
MIQNLKGRKTQLQMNERIKEELHYIIENKQIKTVFQPIISLRDGSVLGHEALSRITCRAASERRTCFLTLPFRTGAFGIWNCFAGRPPWKPRLNICIRLTAKSCF